MQAEKVAMVMIEPRGTSTVTFGSMLSQVRSIAYRLEQEQVAFGDRVAIIGENHPNWAIAYLGILFRGAVATPLDPAATPEVLAHFLKDAEAKPVFVSPGSVAKFRSACEQMGRHIQAVALLPLSEPDVLGRFNDWAQVWTLMRFRAHPRI
jgi:long-subunit acyl-CoA synthetase (AMP-forming)